MINQIVKFFSKLTKSIRLNQYLFLLFLVLATYAFAVGGKSALNKKKSQVNSQKDQISEKIKIASDFLDGQKLLEQHYEDRLKEEQQARTKMQHDLLAEIKKLKEGLVIEFKRELHQIEKKREIDQNELMLSLKNQEPENSTKQPQEIEDFLLKPLTVVGNDSKNNGPKDIGRYIPASTYIKGRLLSGVSVSTGVGVQGDPVPLLIRLTEDANLPQGFGSKLKDCRVIASCYGDLSSERATIRLESMTCIDQDTETAIETKIAGFVVGMDGKNGIRGKVVSVDAKYLKNAAIGGVLSGLSKVAKTENPFVYNPSVGLIQGKEKSIDKFKEGSLDGIGSATDKLANYYIKKAESISPVIEVPAGSLIDIVLTEGVYFGGENVKQQIEVSRR